MVGIQERRLTFGFNILFPQLLREKYLPRYSSEPPKIQGINIIVSKRSALKAEAVLIAVLFTTTTRRRGSGDSTHEHPAIGAIKRTGDIFRRAAIQGFQSYRTGRLWLIHDCCG